MPIKPLIEIPTFLFPQQFDNIKEGWTGKVYTATFAIDYDTEVSLAS